MGDITKNFSHSEFLCECGCGFGLQDVRLAVVLQRLRDHLNRIYEEGAYITISGPERCAKHNKEEGGAEHSKHIEGIACDFKAYTKDKKLISSDIVYEILNSWYPDTFGIGLYWNRVHLDTRVKKARSQQINFSIHLFTSYFFTDIVVTQSKQSFSYADF